MYKERWTNWRGTADSQGRCEVFAFFGRHKATAAGRELMVHLKKSEPIQKVVSRAP